MLLVFRSTVDTTSPACANVNRWRVRYPMPVQAESTSATNWLARERLALLLDAGAPLLELRAMAGHDPANDSGIDAGAITTAGAEKLIRTE